MAEEVKTEVSGDDFEPVSMTQDKVKLPPIISRPSMNPPVTVPEETRMVEVSKVVNGEWQTVLVPEEEAKAEVISEPLDRNIETQLSTDRYDQNMTYYWANVNPKFRNSVTVLGYLPVRTPQSPTHNLTEVPGMGKCVCVGDLVLMAHGRDGAERRDAAYQYERQRNEKSAMDSQVNRVASMFEGDPGLSVTNARFTQEAEQYIPDGRSDDFADDYAHQAADSYAEAMGRQAQEDAFYEQARGANTSRTFGGFSGAAGRGIPESPAMRRGR